MRMASALYCLTLGIASGLVGLWCRRFLAEIGIIHGFEAGVWATAVFACAYATSQAGYRAALLFVKPAQSRALTVSETLSQWAALLLLPSLFGMVIPMPYAPLERVEPLLHFGAFAGVHVFFKLMAFFAATQGIKCSRIRMMPWAALTAITALAAAFSAREYVISVSMESPLFSSQPASYSVGNTHIESDAIPEFAHLIMRYPTENGNRTSLLCAPHPDSAHFPERVYLTLRAYSKPPQEITSPGLTPDSVFTRAVELNPNSWSEIFFEATDFSTPPETMLISWTESAPNPIKEKIGLTQRIESGRKLLMSGLHPLAPSNIASNPSILFIAVEGLGAENMSLYAYPRNTTPLLQERSASLIRCEQAYTPVPETTGACMSLLTGLNPLAHGFYSSSSGSLPEHARTLPEMLRNNGYYTVAFTEEKGTDSNGPSHPSCLWRGFIRVNDRFPTEFSGSGSDDSPEPKRPRYAGARATLQQAASWMESHANVKYFMFLCIRELHEIRHAPRHGEGFIGRGRTPSPVDIYDTEITYLDRQLTALLDKIKESSFSNPPIVVLTSPHGYDFTEAGRGSWRRGGQPKRTLHESCLHVPLVFDIPGRQGDVIKGLISLEDVMPSLLSLLNLPLAHPVDGRNLFKNHARPECISMFGDPVALSVRTGRWRFTWQSGRSPYSSIATEEEAVLDFLDIEQYAVAQSPQNNLKRYPQLAEGFIRQLRGFLDAHAAPPANPAHTP